MGVVVCMGKHRPKGMLFALNKGLVILNKYICMYLCIYLIANDVNTDLP